MVENNKFHNNPNRIKEVENMLDQLIVNERENKMVIFFNLLSCKLEQPNGTIITGEASSGKTHLVREVLKLFPKDWKMIFGGMTKKALIHMKGKMEVDKDGESIIEKRKVIDLTGKILWFLEDTGGEDGFVLLRPILSRDQKEIRYELPTKKRSKGGNEFFMNDVIIVKGCPAFITTSTKIERLPETGTRVFQLSPNETKEQSSAVVRFKLNVKRFLIKQPDFTEIKEYLTSLQQFKVWIPFTDMMYFLCDQLNVRRDIDKIIALTETVTLFNQHDRKTIVINDETYLVATLPDYLIAMEYAGKVLNPTLYNLPKKVLDFYDIIKKKMGDGFTHKQVADELYISQNTVRNYCWQLYLIGKLSKIKESGQNHYYFQKEAQNDVTPVTLKKVTPDIIARSLVDTKEFLKKGVTEKCIYIGNNTLQYIYSLLLYIFSVTVEQMSDFDTTSLQSVVDDVILLKVTDGNTHTCISCGTPTKYLNDDNKCPICSGQFEKEKYDEVKDLK